MGQWAFFQLSMNRFIIAFFCLLCVACSKQDGSEPAIKPTPYVLEIPRGFPSDVNLPKNNPLTVEGIALGRKLFYDGKLSGRLHPDSAMSCATCHIQAHGFECGVNHPTFVGGKTHGITGIPTPHFMLPLLNLAWNDQGYFWNGLVSANNATTGRKSLADIVKMGIHAPHEMDTDSIKMVLALSTDDSYPAQFERAFGSPAITMHRVSLAIEQFLYTLVSAGSRFDKYLQGKLQLTQSELNGYVLFSTENGGDCFHCHGGSGNPLMTTHLFYNNAKDTLFTDLRDRYSVTGNAQDLGAYRAPTLRNIAFTAPYMHDGRFKTLDEVLKFYNQGLCWSPYANPLMHHIANGGIRLSDAQLGDLKAFMLSLSDTSFIRNPAFGPP
jgi:cytochrome c peroxidase